MLTAAPRLGPMKGLPSGLPSVALAPMGCAFCPSTAFCPSGASLQGLRYQDMMPPTQSYDGLSPAHALSSSRTAPVKRLCDSG